MQIILLFDTIKYIQCYRVYTYRLFDITQILNCIAATKLQLINKPIVDNPHINSVYNNRICIKPIIKPIVLQYTSSNIEVCSVNILIIKSM